MFEAFAQHKAEKHPPKAAKSKSGGGRIT